MNNVFPHNNNFELFLYPDINLVSPGSSADGDMPYRPYIEQCHNVDHVHHEGPNGGQPGDSSATHARQL